MLWTQSSRVFLSCLAAVAMCDLTFPKAFPPHLSGGRIILPNHSGLVQINPLVCGRWQDSAMITVTEKIIDKLKVLLSLLAISKWAAFDNVAAPFVLTLCRHWQDWSCLSACLWETNLILWLHAYLCYSYLILHITLQVILSRWAAVFWKEGDGAAKALHGTQAQKWLNPQGEGLTTSFVLNTFHANTGPRCAHTDGEQPSESAASHQSNWR